MAVAGCAPNRGWATKGCTQQRLGSQGVHPTGGGQPRGGEARDVVSCPAGKVGMRALSLVEQAGS